MSDALFRKGTGVFTKGRNQDYGNGRHGGVINAWGLNNTWLFSDFRRSGKYKKDGRTYSYGNRSVADYGFSYEGYLLKCNIRLSDISGYDAVELLKRLRACKPGDRVSLLIHPIHWRRNCPEK